jgi:hypothetical protein
VHVHQLNRLAAFAVSALRWIAPWVCVLVISTTLAFAINEVIGGHVFDTGDSNFWRARHDRTESRMWSDTHGTTRPQVGQAISPSQRLVSAMKML